MSAWLPAHALARSGTRSSAPITDRAKIADLKLGRIPIYEPGLAEMVTRNGASLAFTTEIAEAVPASTWSL